MAKCRRGAPRYAGRVSAVSDGEVVKCKKMRRPEGQRRVHFPASSDRERHALGYCVMAVLARASSDATPLFRAMFQALDIMIDGRDSAWGLLGERRANAAGHIMVSSWRRSLFLFSASISPSRAGFAARKISLQPPPRSM
jgi:hypothetical protein